MRIGTRQLAVVGTLMFATQIPISQSAMYVYPMEVSVGIAGANQVKLISQDDNVQFVKIDLKQVLQPGTKNEHEVDGDANSANELIITPQKIALSPGSERVIRIVSIVPPEKETTWRAYFESVNQDNFLSMSDEEKEKKSAAKIGVNIIWGVLLHVAPKKVSVNLGYLVNTGTIVNNGTVRVPLKEVGFCSEDKKCKWTKITKTIYPGEKVDLGNVKLSTNGHYKIKYLNWISDKIEEAEVKEIK